MILPALLLAAAAAQQPPRAVESYADCVKLGMLDPGEEQPQTFDAALDLAKAQCGNLRPEAVAAVRKFKGKALAAIGEDVESGAQAFLDILVTEQAASIWAEQHPEDVSHAR